MIKLDDIFIESFNKFYKDISPLLVVAKMTEDSLKYDNTTISNVMGLVRTCNTVSESYTDVHVRMHTSLKDTLSEDEIDKLTVDAVFMTIYNIEGREPLEDFLGTKLAVRDIEGEIAHDLYGSAQEEQLEKVRNIGTEDTYSIQKPNPVSRDRWFYDLSVAVGSYAKCHSRKIGAVLVKDNSVISTGYNGPPRGIPTCDQRWFIDKGFIEKYGQHAKDKETAGICPRRVIGFPSGEGLGICPAGHAERNALINAARFGIKTNKTKIYMSCGIPCTPCMVEIVNSGVEEIVCSAFEIYDETVGYLLENCGVKVRLYDFLV